MKRKIHSVLMYKTESGRMGCINRDRNAVLNIRKLVKYYHACWRRETGKRKEKYCREKESERNRKKKAPGFRQAKNK